MNKAYSNKALPMGTVLREWRIEEVLGVGGFGIVYKARGIYFNELVAIKEYFPSSISERDSEDTVVPINSDAEEVHALGLKKFVEEAKLLWNLSTPEPAPQHRQRAQPVRNPRHRLHGHGLRGRAVAVARC